MATPTLLLDVHLKALRLPTFLREYDKVARHCAQEGKTRSLEALYPWLYLGCCGAPTIKSRAERINAGRQRATPLMDDLREW